MFYRCLKFIFVFAALPEVFKTLERDDSGKIELNMQQVCRNITKAAGFSALLIRAASCIMLFFYCSGCAWQSTSPDSDTTRTPFRCEHRERSADQQRVPLFLIYFSHSIFQMLKSLWAILWLTCITCHVSWFFCKYFCSVGKNLVVLVGILLFISYNFCQAIKTC